MVYNIKGTLLRKISSHMRKQNGREGCGFVLKDDSWVPCENTAGGGDQSYPTDMDIVPESSFMIDSGVYLEHSGNIKYIVHSHISNDPKNDEPSITDIMHQKATGVKWLVVVLDSNNKYHHNYLFGESVI